MKGIFGKIASNKGQFDPSLDKVFIEGGLIKAPERFGKGYKFFIGGTADREEVDRIIDVCGRGQNGCIAEKVNSNVGVLWIVYQQPDVVQVKKVK